MASEWLLPMMRDVPGMRSLYIFVHILFTGPFMYMLLILTDNKAKLSPLK